MGWVCGMYGGDWGEEKCMYDVAGEICRKESS